MFGPHDKHMLGIARIACILGIERIVHLLLIEPDLELQRPQPAGDQLGHVPVFNRRYKKNIVRHVRATS
jgi:hypothetical protein